ncbi:hypothetical protein CRUP_030237 [Coryphaenoides rupestris]|nr:hypothetical protein CRUP_030237 [Coryphaenoides rupestris]
MASRRLPEARHARHALRLRLQSQSAAARPSCSLRSSATENHAENCSRVLRSSICRRSLAASFCTLSSSSRRRPASASRSRRRRASSSSWAPCRASWARCRLSRSASRRARSGRSAFCRAMKRLTVSSSRPPLPHTDTRVEMASEFAVSEVFGSQRLASGTNGRAVALRSTEQLQDHDDAYGEDEEDDPAGSVPVGAVQPPAPDYSSFDELYKHFAEEEESEAVHSFLQDLMDRELLDPRTAQDLALDSDPGRRTRDPSELQGAEVLGVVEGGDNLDERLRSARETAKRPVGGFCLDGFQTGAMERSLRTRLIAAVARELPEDKPRLAQSPHCPSPLCFPCPMGRGFVDIVFVVVGRWPAELLQGVGRPDEVVACVEAGVTERGCALTLTWTSPGPRESR